MLNYRPNGRSWLGTPLKRLLEEDKTDLSSRNSWQMMIMMKKKEEKEERRSCFNFMSYANTANRGKRIGKVDVWK